MPVTVTEVLAAIIRVKTVGCFCWGVPTLMFDGVLNTTLSEVSTTGVTQENLELPCLLVLLIHTKHETIR